MVMIIYLLVTSILFCQEYLRIKKADISAKINFDKNKSLYFYQYKIKNDISSTGNLFSFNIDASLQNYKVIDSVGLIFANDLVVDMFRRHYEYCIGKIIPFGISRVPNVLTTGSISLDPSEISFSLFPQRKPGSTVDSLEINCIGLPSIRKVTFSIAKGIVIDQLPDLEDTTSTMTEVQKDSILASLDYCTWTVAPNVFSDNLGCIGIIDSINSYNSRAFNYSWIKQLQIKNKYQTYLSTAKTFLQQHDSLQARNLLENIIRDVDVDSTSNLTNEAYALLRYNTEYLLSKLPKPSGLKVSLANSLGSKLTGGSLQYYDSSWKDAVNNNDGTFSIDTKLKTISLRMTYANATQTKSNVTVGKDTVVFQTVNAQVKLINSAGSVIDTGKVQYYYNSWRNFGSTSNGIASKELLPGSYTFRMTYAAATRDKTQDISVNPMVVFQTVPATVQLKDSQANPLDQGTVQYYFSTWQTFGSTTNGVVIKELLPNSYTFRISYASATNDKVQDVSVNNNVVFQTVLATVQLKSSTDVFLDGGTVQYYFSSWQNFGPTASGVVTKELLPNSYTFRMTHETITKDIVRNISTNNIIKYSTVLCTVRVKDAQSQPVNNATVSYYFNAWKQIGLTAGGQVTKELLPASLTFRANYNSVQKDKVQDISTNNIVDIGL